MAGFAIAAFDLVLFLLVLFFLLRDGARLRAALRPVSPFNEEQEALIFDHLGRTVKGALQSLLVVPLAQGVMAVPAFLLFGVPDPLTWAVAVVLAAMVPLLGSPLGWVPAVVYLSQTGAPTWQWAGMLAYGAVVISGIDNLVKPLLLRGSAQIHPSAGLPLHRGRAPGLRGLRLPRGPRRPLPRPLRAADLPSRHPARAPAVAPASS